MGRVFIGHYSASYVAKAVEPRIPLWLLFLLAQLVDIVWAGLVLAGVEKSRLVPGFTATNDYQLIYVPYSHSLTAAVCWAIGAAGVWLVVRRQWRPALVIAAVVVSHWLLDLLVHTADLPLFGTEYKQGFGLWNQPYLSLGLEAGLLLLGLLFYLRARRPASRGGLSRMWALVIGMIAMQWVALWGNRPSTMTRTAVGGLLAYLLFAALAEWFDRDAIASGPGMTRSCS